MSITGRAGSKSKGFGPCVPQKSRQRSNSAAKFIVTNNYKHINTIKVITEQSNKHKTINTNDNTTNSHLRGARESSLIFILAMLPMLPGVNGASSMSLKAVATDMATEEPQPQR